MAKIKNCAICDKEMAAGLFSGENEYIDVGCATLDCCEDCKNKYKLLAKKHKKRFEAKFINYKKTLKRKTTKQEIGKMFIAYCNEAKEYEDKTRDVELTMFSNFYCYNPNGNGYFSVKEFSNDFAHSDITAKNMVKSMEKSLNDDLYIFDKNDITKIEYAKAGIGDPLGFFSMAFSYSIRLNDEKVLTYKPCITRTALLGNGFIFGYRRSAEKKLLAKLNEFKKTIGSDLPIVKVNKI